MTGAAWKHAAPFVCILILISASCAWLPQKPLEGSRLRTYCRYSASSPAPVSDLPSVVFVFPPLLADSEGKPVEALKPLFDDTGDIVDWQCSSQKAIKLRNIIQRELVRSGFRIADYQEVSTMKNPHSILMLSFFYTKPLTAKDADEDGSEKCILTMVRAKTFDTDLNPATGRVVSTLDGVTFIESVDTQGELVEKTFRILLGHMGDNVSGYANLMPDSI